jgi:hypothetical protein
MYEDCTRTRMVWPCTTFPVAGGRETAEGIWRSVRDLLQYHASHSVSQRTAHAMSGRACTVLPKDDWGFCEGHMSEYGNQVETVPFTRAAA